MLRRLLVPIVLAMVSGSVMAGTVYEYADTSGFTVGTFPSGSSPTSFAFPATGGPISMTRTSTASTGISLTTRTVTFSSASPYGNPAWIAGTRDFFGVVNSATPSVTGGIEVLGPAFGHTITFNNAFHTPLEKDAYLVFTDVEYGEKIDVTAYDGSSVIPFSEMVFTKWNGASSSGLSVDTRWTSTAGITGTLASFPPFGFSNPVVTLQLKSDSTMSISRIQYAIDMGNNTNSLGFNFVVPTSSVPEIDPAGMGSVAALVTGALGLLERRRLKDQVGGPRAAARS